MPDKEIRNVVEKIFYSPATNGKAEQSINEGVEAVQKLLESARYHQSTVAEKGDFNAECYRTACQNSPAVFYNHSTRKYYCPSCAKLINDVNRADAMRLYGHELCTIGYPATPLSESGEKWKELEEAIKEIERLKGLIVEIRGIAGRPLQENALLDYDDRLNKIMILCLKSNTNQ